MKEKILHGGGGLKGIRRCRRGGFHEDPQYILRDTGTVISTCTRCTRCSRL